MLLFVSRRNGRFELSFTRVIANSQLCLLRFSGRPGFILFEKPRQGHMMLMVYFKVLSLSYLNAWVEKFISAHALINIGPFLNEHR